MKNVVVFLLGMWVSIIAGTLSAEPIVWRKQVHAAVPAGSELLAVTQADYDGVAEASVIGLMSFSVNEDRIGYQVGRFDAQSGVRIWSTMLPGACRHTDARGSLAISPGGDVVVAASASEGGGIHYTCVLKIRGTDGSIIWSRVLQTGSNSLRVHALAIDHESHVLLGGLNGAAALIERRDGATGEFLWRRELPAPANASSDAIFIGASAANVVAGVITNEASGWPSLRYVGLSLSAGADVWSNEICARARFSRYSRHTPVARVLPDGSFVYSLECAETSPSSLRMGRRDVDSGVAHWQSELSSSSQNTAVIAADGDIVIGGSLTINGNPAGLARISAQGGATRWHSSVAYPTTWRFLVVTPQQVHVAESVPDEFSNYPIEASLASYDGATGAFAGRMPFPLPGTERLFYSEQWLEGRTDGHVLAYGMHAQAYGVGRSLQRVHLNPVAGQLVSQVSDPVMSARPFLPPLYESPGLAAMVPSDDGEPGFVIVGSGRTESLAYPRVAKLSRTDGRELWMKEFDQRIRGSISDVAADSSGDVLFSGYVQTVPSTVATKLDGSTGAVLWHVTDNRIGSSIVIDSSGDAALSLVLRELASVNAVVKLSGKTGARLWETAIPNGYHEQTVAADQQGNFIVTGSYWSQGTTANQVVKVRGTDGALLWTARGAVLSGGELFRAMPLADGIVITNTDGRLVKLDRSSGAVLWQCEMPLWINAQHLDADGYIVLGGRGSFDGQEGASVARVRATDGVVQWMKYISVAPGSFLSSHRITALSSIRAGELLVAGGDGGRNYFAAQLTRGNGNIEWEVSDGTAMSSSLQAIRGEDFYPAAITQSSLGSIFFGGQFVPSPSTWTLYKVGADVDHLFSSGFE